MKKQQNSWAFWKPIITKKDGSINMTQLKKELADFSHILEQVSLVYEYVTGGRMSKATYFANDVNAVTDNNYRELYLNVFKEMIAELKEGKEISKKAFDVLEENLERYI